MEIYSLQATVTSRSSTSSRKSQAFFDEGDPEEDDRTNLSQLCERGGNGWVRGRRVIAVTLTGMAMGGHSRNARATSRGIFAHLIDLLRGPGRGSSQPRRKDSESDLLMSSASADSSSPSTASRETQTEVRTSVDERQRARLCLVAARHVEGVCECV